MGLGPFERMVRGEFCVIDSVFPQKMPFSFRNTEINEYFNRVRNFSSFTMHPMRPGAEAWFSHGYGAPKKEFKLNKEAYLRFYPENRGRIHYLSRRKRYDLTLAYSFFLAETYVLLPFYEKHHVPFVFVLYPGGGFGLNFGKSDDMLRRVLSSPCFRKVIVTQEITRDYLLSAGLTTGERVEHIYGSIVQFTKEDVRPKKRYQESKSTFDVCFVAAKYSRQGIDKGYDLFIEAARMLAQATPDIMFHVVGGFDADDMDVDDLGGRITFYGYRRPDFLAEFYSGMDVFLSPNRPYKLFTGSFDGFPLGMDAGYCGVAQFVSDPLDMNRHYLDGRDIVLVPLDSAEIASLVLSHYEDLDHLYELSARGQEKAQELFDITAQTSQRLKVFGELARLDLCG
jgi:glycosyltransferase involved in cell wall biosynthesis